MVQAQINNKIVSRGGRTTPNPLNTARRIGWWLRPIGADFKSDMKCQPMAQSKTWTDRGTPSRRPLGFSTPRTRHVAPITLDDERAGIALSKTPTVGHTHNILGSSASTTNTTTGPSKQPIPIYVPIPRAMTPTVTIRAPADFRTLATSPLVAPVVITSSITSA